MAVKERLGGLSLDMRPNVAPAYDNSSVIPVDPKYGSSTLPVEMNDEEDGLVGDLIK